MEGSQKNWVEVREYGWDNGLYVSLPKCFQEGWETEAIPKMSGKYTEKKGFFAKIFAIK